MAQILTTPHQETVVEDLSRHLRRQVHAAVMDAIDVTSSDPEILIHLLQVCHATKPTSSDDDDDDQKNEHQDKPEMFYRLWQAFLESKPKTERLMTTFFEIVFCPDFVTKFSAHVPTCFQTCWNFGQKARLNFIYYLTVHLTQMWQRRPSRSVHGICA